MKKLSIAAYSEAALPHLGTLVARNRATLERLSRRLVEDVRKGRHLLVFGSGHSAIFPLELYHRAGGASFVLPLVAEHLLPTAGPPVVRVLERTPGTADFLLDRYGARAGETLWLASQSGVNSAGVALALEARRRGLKTVAFTSLVHSRAVASRHPSGKKLFEVCDETVDLGGHVGDAALDLGKVRVGPLSSLGAILLGHSVIAHACARLEATGVRCVYTSVNTSEGEARNRRIEARAAKRDPFLR